MGEKDQTLQDIKAGKGLPPLNTQTPSSQSGLTIEQRSGDAGLRVEWNSSDQQDRAKGKDKP